MITDYEALGKDEDFKNEEQQYRKLLNDVVGAGLEFYVKKNESRIFYCLCSKL